MEFLLVAGVGLDAIGALGVVVPDLGPGMRTHVVARTPVLRRFHAQKQRLPANNTDVGHPDDLLDVIESLWPALREADLDVTDSSLADLADVAPRGSNSLRIYDADGRRIAACRIPDLRAAADAYVDRKLRAWGFGLMATGFVLQFAGLLL